MKRAISFFFLSLSFSSFVIFIIFFLRQNWGAESLHFPLTLLWHRLVTWLTEWTWRLVAEVAKVVIVDALSVETPLTGQGHVIYRRPSPLSLSLALRLALFHPSLIRLRNTSWVLADVGSALQPPNHHPLGPLFPLKVVTPIWSNGIADRKP